MTTDQAAPATTVDPFDAQQVRRATGPLADFNRVGVLGAADVHVATRLGRLGPETDTSVLLAVALTVRALRHGSVCLDLATVAQVTAVEGVDRAVVAALPWPEPTAWTAALERSPLVAVGADGAADRPLRRLGGLLYLDRYWRQERCIAEMLDRAAARPQPSVDAPRVAAAVARLFPAEDSDRQRLAAVVAAHRWVSVLAGGPGTGKTTTVAKLLAVLADQPGDPLRVAMAAPTGKAAARLTEAVAGVTSAMDAADQERLGTLKASTLHRLLGWKPGARGRFRHDRSNRLPYDVVVVDEASMVSLTLMARLAEALRDDCRLVLVGDPDQLASVEAGAVLGDLVAREATAPGVQPAGLEELVTRDLGDLTGTEQHAALHDGVVRLSHVHRFSGDILDLAEAVRSGRADDVLDVLARGGEAVEHVDLDGAVADEQLRGVRADTVAAGEDLVRAARSGDAAASLERLDRHRVLCAHREGAYGVRRWSLLMEEWLREAIDGYAREGRWYVGRPLMVTSNDYQLRLFNGDTGVVVQDGSGVRAAFRRDNVDDLLPVSRLSEVQTVHAMSVHRSQGSQFARVTLVLPPADSPLLTRELLYTAITRAKEHVRIVGTAEALAAAVRRPIARASGLRERG
ncbi:exodeoxyribonuclease V subunit alpha [Nocardioides panacis]|uniref:RecBCD enzyme subunit RecD n=1 Tax=Nocardioides panacis TaxID=2849501 RepID=A0A975T1E6_9ACTN|nr:exodeoxyribonuclease V subunit alpha [Nocardioides panacis]QWZ09255.1 exodeoxyribonuclease V subunit alpha [Nocardioides panacis]